MFATRTKPTLIVVAICLILFGLGGLCSSPTDSKNEPKQTPPALGKLILDVTGLPPGIDGDITVIGPTNDSLRITGSATADSLPVGKYVILARPVKDSLGLMVPAVPDSQEVTVVKDKTVNAQVAYKPNLRGSLTVTITGLPSGDDAYVRVYKVGETAYSEIQRTTRLDSLLAGAYQVIAYGVITSKGVAYIPDVDTQFVNVVRGSNATVSVTYKEKYGAIQVNVTGLPSGEDGSARVYRSDWNPANGEYFDVTRSILLDSLLEGTYHIDAIDVTITNGDIYRPQHYFQQVAVVPGNTYVVDIPYSPKFGDLDVTVTGLPSGTKANILLDDYGSNIWTIDQSMVIEDLEEGKYVLNGLDVTGPDNEKYETQPESLLVDIIGGQTTYATMNYVPKWGKVVATVSGLPPGGVLANVTISGAGGYTRSILTLGGDVSLDTLAEGDYIVTADEAIALDGTPYVAKPDTARVTVSARQTNFVQFNYRPKWGKIVVDVSGLPPGGVLSEITVSGGNGDSKSRLTLDGETVFDSLEEGTYTVSANEVNSLDGMPYVPKPKSQQVTLIGGEVKNPSVRYEPKYGKLDLIVTGLPQGLAGHIEVRNEDETRLWSLEGSKLIDSLEVGPYTVVARDVIDFQGDTLSPDPDSIVVDVLSGQTTELKIRYIGGLAIRILNGRPTKCEESGYDEIILNSSSPGDSTREKRVDEQAFDPPNGFVVDNCKVIGRDDPDIAISTVSTGAYGSGSASVTVTYDEVTKNIVMRQQSEAIATTPQSVYRSSITTYGLASFSWAEPNANPPIMIEILNPKGDTVFIDFDWTYSASWSSNFPSMQGHFWEEKVKYTVNPDPCQYHGGQVFEELYRYYSQANPDSIVSGSGSHSIWTTSKYRVIGLTTYTYNIASASYKAAAGEHFEASTASQSELTIRFRVAPAK